MKSFERFLSPEKINTLHRATETCRTLLQKNGIHSVHALKAAGFYYTNKDDSVRCDECQLEVSNWPLDITPFTIHKQLRQDCPFVLSILSDAKVPQPSKIPFTTSNADETSYRHQQSKRLVEIDKMKLTRARTFTNWPHQTSPSSVQMIAAGFFDCCVGDRVICLYCDLICQQWIPNKNDPWEVHKTHSPKCPYVITTMSEYHQEPFNASINEIMNRAACYSTDSKISKQSNVEYINWFPHRLYAEQLCLKELYQKIKNSRPIQPSIIHFV
jgi:E3 ubiquitin-protein ligase XIAP